MTCSDYVKPKTAGGAMTILNYSLIVETTKKKENKPLKITLNKEGSNNKL